MGLVYANIELSGPIVAEFKSLSVRCLVDSGSTYLVLPQHVATQPGLKNLEPRDAITADGSCHSVPYAGRT